MAPQRHPLRFTSLNSLVTLRECARQAARLLEASIRTGDLMHTREVLVTPALVPGDSTAPHPR
jgi:DNA-binding LacI/PurR family transcriptional regulator